MCGVDQWIHVNCALWSSEVYEEADGRLMNVEVARNRGRGGGKNFRQESVSTV